MTKKQILASVLALVILLLSFPLSVSAEATGITDDGFEYSIDTEAGEVTVTGYNGTEHHLVIPSTIEDYPVKYIGSKAFRSKDILSIVLPSELTQIGSQAFYGSNLMAIHFPKSLTYIGDHAFHACTLLEYGSVCYKGNEYKWESVSIAQGNDVLMYHSINYNTDGITDSGFVYSKTDGNITIADYFANDTAVEIPSEIEGCPVIGIDSDAFRFSYITSVVIPGSIKNISGYSFYGSRLNTLTLSDGIEALEDYAFYSCDELKKVYIPETVSYISSLAFLGCNMLTEITVSESNPVYLSKNDCIIHRENKALVIGSMYSTIPDDGSVISIGEYAFEDRINYETELIIPEPVEIIADNAFFNCSITSIKLPETLTHIGERALEDSMLSEIVIPRGVEYMGANIFGTRVAPKTVYYLGTKTEWNNIDINETNIRLFEAELIFLGNGNGDADGDGEICASDAVLMRMYLASRITDSNIDIDRADLNGDGKVNAHDQLILRKKIAA